MRPPPFPILHPNQHIRLLSLSLPTLISTMSSTSKPPTPPPSPPPPPSSSSFPPPTPYTPTNPTGPFPYQPTDFLRADESPDTDFYSAPRFVTHIDDHAIALLKRYYAENLPRKGRVLDLCSSWVSHFPPELEAAALAGKRRKESEKRAGKGEEKEEEEESLQVLGLGLNSAELASNPLLSTTILHDLNANPTLPPSLSLLSPPALLTATVCVVSIDYLTNPLAVLSSLRDRTRDNGSVHLVLSNRCFPTKAVGRWVRSGEQERIRMVGDYLWWSGWRSVEVVELCDGRRRKGEDGGGEEEGIRGGWGRVMGMLGGGVDPLWVVRGVKVADGEGGARRGEGKSEL